MVSHTLTTKARSARKEHEKNYLCRHGSSVVRLRARVSWLMQLFLQRARECARPFAVTDDSRNPRGRRQFGTAIDGRHSQIEFRTFGSTRQDDADRVKQRFPFLPRPGLDAVRHLAKFLAVEPRRG